MNLTCEDLVEMILDFVDGQLSADQIEQFQKHLCDCKPCVIQVETYRFTMHVSRALPKCEALPPAFESRLRDLLNQEAVRGE